MNPRLRLFGIRYDWIQNIHATNQLGISYFYLKLYQDGATTFEDANEINKSRQPAQNPNPEKVFRGTKVMRS